MTLSVGATRLPNSAHSEMPWRIHEIAPDFEIEDVWALPTPGGPDDFPRLISAVHDNDFPNSAPLPVRGVWAVRMKLGELFDVDSESATQTAQSAALIERLPAELNEADGPNSDNSLFPVLYTLPNEWAGQLANKTVHAIMHLGWVPDGAGGYRGQMAVLVKPNGPLGTAYMAFIKPFRHLLVYPALMRIIARRWNTLSANETPEKGTR